jgi:putative endonuclease
MRLKHRTQWRQHAYVFGMRAERLARLLLMLKGYKILVQRWASPVGEIDIIARRRNTLVFVEVKARQTLNSALECVRPHQKARIVRGAQDFIAKHPHYADFDLRFDAIAVAPNRLPRHIVNAFDSGRG